MLEIPAWGKGKGGLCQKEMFMIVLINCSISPRIPWAAGNNLISAVLFFGSNRSLCGDPHKSQLGVLLLNVPRSLVSPDTVVEGDVVWQAFGWPETRASVLGKSQMKGCSWIRQNWFVCFCTEELLALALCESRYWGTDNFTLHFGALKLVLSTPALSIAAIDAFAGRKAFITFLTVS